MSKEQKLLNAQVEVNRAVFLSNAQDNQTIGGYEDVDASNEAIMHHICSAIEQLRKAREGYRPRKPAKGRRNKLPT